IVIGPEGQVTLRLAVDTGATQTVIPPHALFFIGYDPHRIKKRKRITTGSGVERVAQLKVAEIQAMGHTRRNLKIIAHSLPPNMSADGLLGADFMFGRVLTVDYARGFVELAKP